MAASFLLLLFVLLVLLELVLVVVSVATPLVLVPLPLLLLIFLRMRFFKPRHPLLLTGACPFGCRRCACRSRRESGCAAAPVAAAVGALVVLFERIHVVVSGSGSFGFCAAAASVRRVRQCMRMQNMCMRMQQQGLIGSASFSAPAANRMLLLLLL